MFLVMAMIVLTHSSPSLLVNQGTHFPRLVDRGCKEHWERRENKQQAPCFDQVGWADPAVMWLVMTAKADSQGDLQCLIPG